MPKITIRISYPWKYRRVIGTTERGAVVVVITGRVDTWRFEVARETDTVELPVEADPAPQEPGSRARGWALADLPGTQPNKLKKLYETLKKTTRLGRKK